MKMDTQKLVARLRERAATQDACGCWSLDKIAADELERLTVEVYRLAVAVAERDEMLGKLTTTLVEEVNRK